MPRPTKIYREEGKLAIDWNDQSKKLYSLLDLRDACPCAFCIDEWTREKTLKRVSIAANINIEKIDSVGQYALQFQWNDGHNTGIYTFDLLKSLGTSE